MSDSRRVEFRGGNLAAFRSREPQVLLCGPAGTGKAQPLDAVVYTPTGPRLMGDIKVCDLVSSPTAKVATVLQIHPQGLRAVYAVTFNTGETVECTSDHLWEVFYTGGGKRNGKKRKEMRIVVPLKRLMLDYLTGSRRRPKYYVRQSMVKYAERRVDVNPYLLGVLLGDGCLVHNSLSFTTADDFIASELRSCIPEYHDIINDSTYTYRIVLTKGVKELNSMGFIRLRERLRRLGVYDKGSSDKFIPDVYKYNSVSVRLGVLQGLMDTDGTVDRKTGMPSYTSISKHLAYDVKELVESLGGICTITTKQPSNGQLAYTVWIRYSNNKGLFRLPRKSLAAKNRSKYPVRRYISSIRNSRNAVCQCITLDTEDGLYFTNHCVVTHNSYAVLMKLYCILESVPKIRILILRKYRRSLTDTALVTWEDQVLPERHPCKAGAGRGQRHSYKFANGAELVCGGLDNPDKILSSEYDIAYIQEATECDQEDLDKLDSRLRNGVLSYQQLIMDCNPSHPRHWLKQRCDNGLTKLYTTTHKDNPKFHDGKDWTKQGEAYVGRLQRLTGHTKLRLCDGIWAAAEGLVYADWKDDYKVDIGDITFKPYFLSVDFGFNNFSVCQWWAKIDNSRLAMYRELVCCHTTVEIFAKWVKELNAGKPLAVVCDHDKEDRATFEQYSGFPTTPAQKDIEFGIHRTQEYIAAGRILVSPRALIRRESKGGADQKPQGILEEIVSYVWDENKLGLKEVPRKENDHSMDCMRYAVCFDYLYSNRQGVKCA